MSQTANETFSLVYLSERRGFVRFSKPERAFLQYKSFRLDLLSGEKDNLGVEDFLAELELEQIGFKREKPRIVHLFYELGHAELGAPELIKENTILAVSLEYSRSDFHSLKVFDKESDRKNRGDESLKLAPLQYPRFDEYKEKFALGMERLLAGDCYQLNLTRPFFFKMESETRPLDFLFKAWSRADSIGAYAHCTYLAPLNKLYFSNSPECLFQYSAKKNALYSMPIKGTVPAAGEGDRSKAWRRLQACPKEQAELFMISDLVRNDLTGVQMNPAKVLAKKLPLHVPGIVHQYSLVAVQAKESLNVRQCLRSLFPGGSVTGAPKKRVARILSQLENYQRGFYCGSTLVLHKSLQAASINIRSCEADFSIQELKCCAGGGITLKSKDMSEFEEMYAKMESFLCLFRD